jgi:hypothetical protein
MWQKGQEIFAGAVAATAAIVAAVAAVATVAVEGRNRMITKVKITKINTAAKRQNPMRIYGKICPMMFFKKGSITRT